ncbi:hypothetical protein BpHYR1_048633 [Brachionus plicatilis]|uniref:Uncharacterized protein n=1 Tax=Brachionus plicatilis TaxID=10195 RepID=A0A3M7QIW4_BRAPC|nr:hypothetical protein BpHYR1_048633 [Brachionus plicatilis]
MTIVQFYQPAVFVVTTRSNQTFTPNYIIIEEPKVSYSWLKELPFSSYHCTTYKIPIRGYTADEKLYGNSQSSCLPRDLFCQVEGSTYIWEKDIIHECPFSYLASLKLNVSGHIAISESQLFDINGSTRECGMELLTTTEGLDLTKNNESQKLPSENDLNTEHQLMLTDIDYKTMMSKATNKIHRRLCDSLENLYSIFRRRIQEFFKIRDNLENELIIYNNFGELIVTSCVNISEIKILNNQLFNDISVEFKFKNKVLKGFLSNSGIVKSFSDHEQTTSTKVVTLPSEEQVIIKNGPKIKIMKSTRQKHLINFNSVNENLNFDHTSLLLKNFDILKEIESFTMNKPSELFNNKAQKETISTNLNLLHYISTKLRKVKESLFTIIEIVIVTTLLIYTIFILIKYWLQPSFYFQRSYWGLPETPEGFKCILVITEPLIRKAWAYCIRKLEANYLGPYVVVKQAKGVNYKLTTVYGKYVKSLPRNKLKVVPKSDDAQIKY